MKLLIIEDDTDFAAELSGALKVLGHEFVMTGAVGEALKVLEQQARDFDLVLTDVRLPGRDGLELLRLVKAHYNQMPVAIMTGHGDADVTIQALRGGVFDFLSKPFGLAELEAMLGRVPKGVLREGMQTDTIIEISSETGAKIVSSQASLNSAVTVFREIYGDYCSVIEKDINIIALCFTEALQNAIIHGNFGIDSAQKDDFDGFDAFWQQVNRAEKDEMMRNKPVEILIKTDGSGLSIQVTDQGTGFDHSHCDFEGNDTIVTHGRGLRIMHELAKSVEFQGVGNSVIMRF